jgi:hypothetical protein
MAGIRKGLLPNLQQHLQPELQWLPVSMRRVESCASSTYLCYKSTGPTQGLTRVPCTCPARVDICQWSLHCCSSSLRPQQLPQPCCCPMSHGPDRAQHITAQLVSQALKGPAARLCTVPLRAIEERMQHTHSANHCANGQLTTQLRVAGKASTWSQENHDATLVRHNKDEDP